METSFLSLTPLKRFQKIRVLLKIFATNSQTREVNFATLVYGSGSYGFNKETHGNFHDVDLLLIIPRDPSVEALISSIESVFLTKLQVNISHIQKMIVGDWDMCRMYGETHGVKLGFRIMCIDSFLVASSDKGSISNIRNIATIGHSRIVADTEWSFKLWKYVPITLEHSYIQNREEQLLMVSHHTFSKGKTRLGALGRKLLMARVLYDPYDYVNIGLANIYKQVVVSSLRNKEIFTDEQIIESFFRVERFSESFKETLQKISLARDLL